MLSDSRSVLPCLCNNRRSHFTLTSSPVSIGSPPRVHPPRHKIIQLGILFLDLFRLSAQKLLPETWFDFSNIPTNLFFKKKPIWEFVFYLIPILIALYFSKGNNEKDPMKMTTYHAILDRRLGIYCICNLRVSAIEMFEGLPPRSNVIMQIILQHGTIY
ncbi:unnamed protein product [Lactuca saligna]|uniref:Uncharacterized protein n=1 Tax=Lactuca saligna TaxID=75948 RepID=A0AA35YUN4_LACSI|nr:unnamed protein product [Lactuca saligna]